MSQIILPKFALLIASFVILNINCDNREKQPSKVSQIDINTNTLFKDLLVQSKSTFATGKISNIDSLNGFRLVKLGSLKSSYNLTEFSQFSTVPNPYNIEILEQKVEVPFDTQLYPMNFELTFCRDTLINLRIEYLCSSDMIIEGNCKSPISVEDLVIVFSIFNKYTLNKNEAMLKPDTAKLEIRMGFSGYGSFLWDGKKTQLKYTYENNRLADETAASYLGPFESHLLEYTMKNKLNILYEYFEYLELQNKIQNKEERENSNIEKTRKF